MKPDEEKPHLLMGRAGLVFAYVCFGLALATIGAAIHLLPLAFKVKIFLGLAALVLTSMFVFMAIATHLVLRPNLGGPPKPARPLVGKIEAADAGQDPRNLHEER